MCEMCPSYWNFVDEDDDGEQAKKDAEMHKFFESLNK